MTRWQRFLDVITPQSPWAVQAAIVELHLLTSSLYLKAILEEERRRTFAIDPTVSDTDAHMT